MKICRAKIELCSSDGRNGLHVSPAVNCQPSYCRKGLEELIPLLYERGCLKERFRARNSSVSALACMCTVTVCTMCDLFKKHVVFVVNKCKSCLRKSSPSCKIWLFYLNPSLFEKNDVFKNMLHFSC
jgi:hypothetical protein